MSASDHAATPGALHRSRYTVKPTGVEMVKYRLQKTFSSPMPYLMVLGIFTWLFVWWLLTEVLQFWQFARMPGPVMVIREWFSTTPFAGMSIFMPEYYEHIWASVRRILLAFGFATALGVPLGLLIGWSDRARDYIFPIIEVLRPIPPLAWVPLAILMFRGFEAPVVFLAALASFYATTLNTMLGVQSIDKEYFRAAGCLGSSKWQVFRHVVVPGAMPYIFTGLQISVGVAWFSLVAAEMVSGDLGLGYLILQSYMNAVTIPMVIGMITLGIVGWISSGIIRSIGARLMEWHTRALAMQGR